MGEPAEAEDAKVLVLRDPDSGQPLALEDDEVNAEAVETAKSQAAKRRAIFEHRKTGADTRAGQLPRAIIPVWANAVTNLMLGKLLTEELVPTTAKEAMEIARMAAQVGREAVGEGKGGGPLTEEERKKRLEEATALEAKLRERAAQAKDAELAGANADGDIDLAAFDLDDEVPSAAG